MPTIKQEQAAAMALGRTTFISVNLCRNGHYPTKRYTRNGGCSACQGLANANTVARSMGLAPLSMRVQVVNIRVDTPEQAEQVKEFADMLCGRRLNVTPKVVMPPCPPAAPKPLAPFTR